MEDTRWLPVDRLKRRLGVEAVTLSEGDTARMESALRAAQAEIEAATGRRFVPVYKTVAHWARAGQAAIPLRDDLLQLVSVTDADGALYQPDELIWESGAIALAEPYAFSGGEVRIAGLWAHHPAPGRAFRESGDSLAGDIGTGTVSIAVANADAPDAWGDTPRFAPGLLVRLDDELLRITAVNGNTLTVRRGENGTEAAAHTAGTPVDIYVPGFMVESLGLRLAAWLYREPDGEHGREWPKGIERGVEKLRRFSA